MVKTCTACRLPEQHGLACTCVCTHKFTHAHACAHAHTCARTLTHAPTWAELHICPAHCLLSSRPRARCCPYSPRAHLRACKCVRCPAAEAVAAATAALGSGNPKRSGNGGRGGRVFGLPAVAEQLEGVPEAGSPCSEARRQQKLVPEAAAVGVGGPRGSSPAPEVPMHLLAEVQVKPGWEGRVSPLRGQCRQVLQAAHVPACHPRVLAHAQPGCLQLLSHGYMDAALASYTQKSTPPFFLPAHIPTLQVLCISLTIRDSAQRDVALLELRDVNAEFGAMGERQEAQLCVKRLQVVGRGGARIHRVEVHRVENSMGGGKGGGSSSHDTNVGCLLLYKGADSCRMVAGLVWQAGGNGAEVGRHRVQQSTVGCSHASGGSRWGRGEKQGKSGEAGLRCCCMTRSSRLVLRVIPHDVRLSAP